ncbi:helix-turn-helix domain-containing protein [Streptomyces sp. SID8378]|nr:helix-turn-helix domain-containing protein [Streptomyces sp. SID8378]
MRVPSSCFHTARSRRHGLPHSLDRRRSGQGPRRGSTHATGRSHDSSSPARTPHPAGPLHSGSTTTEIARLLRISPASASEHATVLREAGLIQTARHGNRVLHTSTELGRNLLNSPARRP